jgi:hypothetical protein
MECRYLNGNSLDNRLENLVWGTPAENMADRRAMRRGVVLDADKVRFIRRLEKSSYVLARELGCDGGHIRRVRRGEIWADVV